ncbi:unnamed protein product [Bursaphelenchus xylophilus]|uniref:(pine wood nematode) hypothetical protein n=1 Tax=Bursaphelenchus xylophilus TaxID=6326 RepID=A0A1I7RLL4_BURXY|nr:unnamed protein product [Bursaphelenchus xylophilus]CAG9082869.1 unnamed protein product [Bursaphelenchus xylophilus]
MLRFLLLFSLFHPIFSFESSGHEPEKSTSNAYSLSFQEDAEPVEYTKLCNQLYYKICNQRIGKEDQKCRDDCKVHLSGIVKEEKAMQCFAPMEELKKWDKCLEDGADLFDSSSTRIPQNEVNRFNYSLEDDYSRFRSQNGAVIVKKARKSFVAFRKFQHCYIHCMKRYEQMCHGLFNCAISYPESEDMITIMKECQGLGKMVLDNTKDTCKCLSEGHDVTKLLGQCSLMGSRVFMRRI